VDDHVAGIDQHPVAMRHALDPDAGQAGIAKVLEHALGHRTNMPVRPSGGHDQVVGDGRFIAQVDGGGVLGLHVVEAVEDDTQRLRSVRTHLGDEIGTAAGAGPGDYSYGQRFLPFGFAGPLPSLPPPAGREGRGRRTAKICSTH